MATHRHHTLPSIQHTHIVIAAHTHVSHMITLLVIMDLNNITAHTPVSHLTKLLVVTHTHNMITVHTPVSHLATLLVVTEPQSHLTTL